MKIVILKIQVSKPLSAYIGSVLSIFLGPFIFLLDNKIVKNPYTSYTTNNRNTFK